MDELSLQPARPEGRAWDLGLSRDSFGMSSMCQQLGIVNVNGKKRMIGQARVNVVGPFLAFVQWHYITQFAATATTYNGGRRRRGLHHQQESGTSKCRCYLVAVRIGSPHRKQASPWATAN